MVTSLNVASWKLIDTCSLSSTACANRSRVVSIASLHESSGDPFVEANLAHVADSASTARAWIGTIAFLFLAPGIVAGFIPWLITGWQWHDWDGAAWVILPVAWLVIALGVTFLLYAFALFAVHHGTPAPIAPTQTLVVTGVYRFVRNPMYLAVLAIILGQALLFGSWWLVLYAGIALAAVVAFVKGYEEPTLTRTYGDQYLDYRRNVPGWWPRLTPWGR
jgi:protein-S-isoprenylcysteine O-methyltransferase Ste14